jgi:hypothetical protein
LTTVDYFDQLLGLIKNLGRHSSPGGRPMDYNEKSLKSCEAELLVEVVGVAT